MRPNDILLTHLESGALAAKDGSCLKSRRSPLASKNEDAMYGFVLADALKNYLHQFACTAMSRHEV